MGFNGEDISTLLQPDDGGSYPPDPITIYARRHQISQRHVRWAEGRLVAAPIKTGYKPWTSCSLSSRSLSLG